MAKAGYSATTTADVALVAATAKTVIGVRSHANFGLDLRSVSWEFEGVSATGTPVLCELCYCTWATNPPGTASTSETVQQEYGRVITAGLTAARAWTTEPTALTVLRARLIHPQAGLVYNFPLGEGLDCALSEGFALRLTAAAAVDCRADMGIERC